MTDQFWIFPFAVAVFIVSGVLILDTKLGRLLWFSTLVALALVIVWRIDKTDNALAETCRAEGYSPAGGGLRAPYCADQNGRIVIRPEVIYTMARDQ